MANNGQGVARVMYTSVKVNICKCDKRLLCKEIKEKQYTHIFVRTWMIFIEEYMQICEVL